MRVADLKTLKENLWRLFKANLLFDKSEMSIKDLTQFAKSDGVSSDFARVLTQFSEVDCLMEKQPLNSSLYDLIEMVENEIRSRQRHISVSEIQTLKRCSLQHALRYHGRYYLKNDDKSYLRIGSWTHQLIERLYVDYGYDGVELHGDAQVLQELKEILEKWKDAAQAGKSKEESDQIEIDTAIAFGCFYAYYVEGFKVERLQGYTLTEENTEKYFKLPILSKQGRKSPKYRFKGYMDQLYLGLDEQYYLGEIKTKSSWGKSGIKHLELDEQITGYLWQLKQQGIDAAGVVYTILKKPGIRPKKIPVYQVISNDGSDFFCEARLQRDAELIKKQAYKDGLDVDVIKQKRIETAEEYAQRVIEDYKSRPEFYFFREIVERTPQQIQAFGRRLRFYAKRAAENTIENAFPEPADPFNNYCNFCDYRDVCQHWFDDEKKEKLLAINFSTPRERAFEKIKLTQANDELLGDF